MADVITCIRGYSTPSSGYSKTVVARAKYGDESIYFDLGDVEATTGHGLTSDHPVLTL